ncbi:PD40 domain-containing protein [Shewanella sp. UCD-KL12]|uniref:PD40 domain-containing protein n=1 Tax=Shewanella sp. UCD-KL12 TaxID=1917163 RepID=UPI0009FB3C56|nr:PD40 domain-containing protein [Shewanella sp. UCD-KL12]
MPTLAAGYDIALYPLTFNHQDSSWRLGKGKLLTDRSGYDNQAAFTSDSKSILFASDRSGKHNDIYQYQFEHNGSTSAILTQQTNTPNESEYSPQPLKLTDKHANADKQGIRYIIEQGVPHQSVWQQQNDESRTRSIKSMIPTGYYAHHEELGTLLWARYAYSLYFEANSDTPQAADERHFVVANAGRSIHAIPKDRAFSYLHKQQDGDRVIKRFDPISASHRSLISVGSGSEDYAWSNNSWIFNIDKDQLNAWPSKADKNSGWLTVASLKPPTHLHHSASRIAISPDLRHIAIVWSRNEK